MTLLSKLQATGLPVITATEDGALAMGPMTAEQDIIFLDVLIEHFRPDEYAELLAYRENIQQLRNNYTWAITRLEQIQAATNPTNAQVIQAIKDEALILERTLKLLKNIFM